MGRGAQTDCARHSTGHRHFQPETAPYYGMYLRSIEAGAATMAVELISVQVHSETDIKNVILKVGSETDGGLFVFPDSHNVVHLKRIIALAAKYHLPPVFYLHFLRSTVSS